MAKHSCEALQIHQRAARIIEEIEGVRTESGIGQSSEVFIRGLSRFKEISDKQLKWLVDIEEKLKLNYVPLSPKHYQEVAASPRSSYQNFDDDIPF